MEAPIDIKYFPTWERYLEMFREAELTKPQLGWLWLSMMEYQFENKEPKTVPKPLKMSWTYLRKDLDDARRHYEARVQNGRKGGRKKNQEEPEKTEPNQEKVMSTTTTTTSSTTTTTTPSTTSSINTGSAPAQDAGVGEDKFSFGEFGWVKLTRQQHSKLEALMGAQELSRCIAHIDELAQSTGNRNKWKDWYLMVRRCHDQQWHETGHPSRKPEIPKGASGVLGEAELEAIARVLRE